MSKISILFGAGAEISYGLTSGQDFAKTVIGISENSIEMNQAVKEYYCQFNNLNDWYPNYLKDKFNVERLLEACIRKNMLTENDFDTKKDFEDVVKNEKLSIKEDLKVNDFKDVDYNTFFKNKRVNNYLNNHLSYMGLLEEKFHTLISPKQLGRGSFWTVVSCYTRAYLAFYEQFLKDKYPHIKSEYYLDILNNKKKYYEEFFEWLKNKECSSETYYDVLESSNNKENINVITTNYTPLIELKGGFDSKQVSYLHGKLNWFESVYKWMVYDVTESDLPKDDVLFPYIFIQSGVKPIVEKRQIKEYAKSIDFLEDSETLIIIGFRLNCDDNHIIGMIRDFLVSKKTTKLVYFDFDNIGEEKLYKILRLEENEINHDRIEIICFKNQKGGTANKEQYYIQRLKELVE